MGDTYVPRFWPPFSLWQDRAQSFWGIFLIHQQQSYLLGYKNYQFLQKSIFLAPNSIFSSIFLGPIFSGQRHTPISFQAEYPPPGHCNKHHLLQVGLLSLSTSRQATYIALPSPRAVIVKIAARYHQPFKCQLRPRPRPTRLPHYINIIPASWHDDIKMLSELLVLCGRTHWWLVGVLR